MRNWLCVITLISVGLSAGCAPSTAGTYTLNTDGGQTVSPTEVTAADIGARCFYDPANGENPDNTCPKPGMTCLINTSDGLYRRFDKPAWEDHFTMQEPGGLESGTCTILLPYSEAPPCPAGTNPKLFEPGQFACLRGCAAATDCARSGEVCDFRFFDLAGGACVAPCVTDTPDCVRNGWLKNEDGAFRMHLAMQDLGGEAVCDRQAGVCRTNQTFGQSGPGQQCTDSTDCIQGTVCWQPAAFGLPDAAGGFCAGMCNPVVENSCPGGQVCQPGLTLGHGDAVTEEPLQGFLVVDVSNAQPGVGGGWCFQECLGAGEQACALLPPTQCGPADTAVLQGPAVSNAMCLPSVIRAGP